MSSYDKASIAIAIVALVVSLGSLVYNWWVKRWKAEFQKGKAYSLLNSFKKLQKEIFSSYAYEADESSSIIWGNYQKSWEKKWFMKEELSIWDEYISGIATSLRKLLDKMVPFTHDDFHNFRDLVKTIKRRALYQRKILLKNRYFDFQIDKQGRRLVHIWTLDRINPLRGDLSVDELITFYKNNSPFAFKKKYIESNLPLISATRHIYFPYLGKEINKNSELGVLIKNLKGSMQQNWEVTVPSNSHEDIIAGFPISMIGIFDFLTEKIDLDDFIDRIENNEDLSFPSKVKKFKKKCKKHGEDFIYGPLFKKETKTGMQYGYLNANHSFRFSWSLIPKKLLPMYSKGKSGRGLKVLLGGYYEVHLKDLKADVFLKKKYPKIGVNYLENSNIREMKFQKKVLKRFFKASTKKK